MKKELVVGINLINFEDKNLGGTGYFVKRLFQIFPEIKPNRQFKIYLQEDVLPTLFSIDDQKNSIVRVPKFKNKIHRIFYEQFILPAQIQDINVLICPSVSVPILLRKKIKVVTIIHDLVPFIIQGKYSLIQNFYVKLITLLSAKRADQIVTVSQNTKKDIIKYLKVPSEKIEIVYNFIPGKKFSPSLVFNKFFISVNQIDPAKNLERAIEAFDIFLNTVDNSYKFYLIGKRGWNYKKIYKKVDELQLNKSVIFLDYVPEEKLDEYYETCKGLIYVSLYEGFGIPPLEALYFGKASVVSNNSSLPEVVGDSGILVDPLNVNDIVNGMKKIAKLEHGSELIDKMKVQIVKFDPMSNVKKLLKIIDDL